MRKKADSHRRGDRVREDLIEPLGWNFSSAYYYRFIDWGKGLNMFIILF